MLHIPRFKFGSRGWISGAIVLILILGIGITVKLKGPKHTISELSRHSATSSPAPIRSTTTNITNEQPRLGGPFAVSTRDRLRICVQVAPGLDKEAVLKHIGTLLRTIQEHQDWELAGYGDLAPTPELGYPGAQLPQHPIRAAFDVVGPGKTTDPSPYRTAIIVVDDATAQTVLRDQKAQSVP